MDLSHIGEEVDNCQIWREKYCHLWEMSVVNIEIGTCDSNLFCFCFLLLIKWLPNSNFGFLFLIEWFL